MATAPRSVDMGKPTSNSYTREALAIIKMVGILNAAKRNALSEREFNFLTDMGRKVDAYGLGLFVTERQLFYLRDVKDKLVGKGLV